MDLDKISGSFIPIVSYLDLRGPIPELKYIKSKFMNLESIELSIGDEYLSEDNEINVNVLNVHEQALVLFGDHLVQETEPQRETRLNINNIQRARRNSYEEINLSSSSS